MPFVVGQHEPGDDPADHARDHDRPAFWQPAATASMTMACAWAGVMCPPCWLALAARPGPGFGRPRRCSLAATVRPVVVGAVDHSFGVSLTRAERRSRCYEGGSRPDCDLFISSLFVECPVWRSVSSIPSASNGPEPAICGGLARCGWQSGARLGHGPDPAPSHSPGQLCGLGALRPAARPSRPPTTARRAAARSLRAAAYHLSLVTMYVGQYATADEVINQAASLSDFQWFASCW